MTGQDSPSICQSALVGGKYLSSQPTHFWERFGRVFL